MQHNKRQHTRAGTRNKLLARVAGVKLLRDSMKRLLLAGLFFLSGCSSTGEVNARIAPQLENDTSAYGCKKPPQFPISAIRKKVEGWAIVEFRLDEDGYPSNMKILDSNPEGYFEKAALESLSSCRFRANKNLGSEHRYSSKLDFKYS